MSITLLEASPTVTLPLWLVILAPLLTAITPLIALWLNRKRRDTRKSEVHHTDAETRRLEIDTVAIVTKQLRDTRIEIGEMAEESRQKAEESRRQLSFLRQQVRFHEELSILARQAAHSAINEIQRCVFAVRIRDDAIRDYRAMLDGTPLPEALEPFEQKQYEEIVKWQELPLPEKGNG